MPTDPRAQARANADPAGRLEHGNRLADRVSDYVDHRWAHATLAGHTYDLTDPERRRLFEAWLCRIVYDVNNGWEQE